MKTKIDDRDQIVADRLYSRNAARPFLGNPSDPTLRRLEKDGVLRPVKLNRRSPVAQVYYRGSDLLRLIDG